MPSGIDQEHDRMVPARESMQQQPRSNLHCLNVNVCIPPVAAGPGPFPVLFWIPGGSFVFGGSNFAVYDPGNLGSWASGRGTPLVIVACTYRVGAAGFLASHQIRADLEKDGFSGAGNFGLTDIQLALEWGQTHIAAFGGDKHRVTVVGESAGAISIGALIGLGKEDIHFNRAILMSCQPHILDFVPLSDWDKRYNRILEHFGIDSKQPGALDELRAISEVDVTDALNIGEGAMFNVGSPCNDGVLTENMRRLDWTKHLPAKLETLVLGHTKDESVLFIEQTQRFDFAHCLSQFTLYMTESDARAVFALYGYVESSPLEAQEAALLQMLHDGLFKMQDWRAARSSRLNRTFCYNFDQVATLENTMKGWSHHAIDLHYLFMNRNEDLTPDLVALARKFSGSFIDVAYGKEPWARFAPDKSWMVFGPNDSCVVKSEAEQARHRPLFTRAEELARLGLMDAFIAAVQDLTFEKSLKRRALDGNIMFDRPALPST